MSNKRIDPSKLQRFYMVVKEGGVTKAAKKMNISQPSLSKTITDFEYEVGVILFDRSKGMRLTAQGERLYAYAKQLFETHEAFERTFQEKEDELEGELKIITLPYIGTDWIAPHIKGFLKAHPKITLQIILCGEEIRDMGEYDIAICPFIPHQPNLIHEHLYTTSIHLFASQNYLKEFGVPQKPEDLIHHNLIVYRESHHSPYENWSLHLCNNVTKKPKRPYIQVYSLRGMINFALNDLGIVEAPDLTAIVESGLVRVLPDIPSLQVPIYFIYNKDRGPSKKITLLLDHLLEKGKALK